MSVTSAEESTWVPAFVCGWPSTLTWPARISARARSREEASPFSTTSSSRRTRTFCNLKSPRDSDSLIRAVDDPAADLQEARVRQLGRRERRRRALEALARHPLRRVEAIERGIRRLAGRRVLAGRLSELRRCPFNVQHVVDNLKRKAELRRGEIGRASCRERV